MTQAERKTMEEWFDPDGKVTCKRPKCGYRWWSKGDHKPLACPKCKRYDWDKKVYASPTAQNPGGPVS